MRHALVFLLLVTPITTYATTGMVMWGESKYDYRDFDQPFVAIATGEYHNIALNADGKVVTWGLDYFRACTLPAGVSDMSFSSIDGGTRNTVALRTDGTVMAWGDNEFGQTNVPANLSEVTAIATGCMHTLALKSDGTVVAWGYNTHGQSTVPAGINGIKAIATGYQHSVVLGNGGYVSAWGRSQEGQVYPPIGLSGVTAIAAGLLHTIALKSDGTVVAWGANSEGQCDVPAGLSGVTAISARGNVNAALKSDGTVVVWGQNDKGQCEVPAGLTDVAAVKAASNHVLALKRDGSTVAWGGNRNNQIFSPDAIYGVHMIDAGDAHCVALRTDGSVMVWGNDNHGKIDLPAGLSGVAFVSGGAMHSTAIRTDGSLVAWGNNTYGQCNIPEGLSEVTAISSDYIHNLSLKRDGTVVAWGYNASGQSTVPAGLTGVQQVAAGGNNSFVLKKDGSVVVWGSNNHGLLSVPAAATNITAISAGYGHIVALRSDGTVVAWGRNSEGQTNVPVGLTDVVEIAAGHRHTVVRKADGTVVAWGMNGDGQANVPAGLTGITAISAGRYHTVALVGTPQMTVFDGDLANAALSNGATAKEFGRRSTSNGSIVRTFTIKNTGTAQLRLRAIQSIGIHPGDFRISLPPASRVNPTKSTTFQVTFDPTQPGLRTAVVSIDNDDPERDPFTFAVSGFGALDKLLGQDISFTAPESVFLGEGPVELAAEASSGLPVTLEVLSGPGTLAGDVLTLTGVGKVTVRATQQGGGNYAPAKAVTRVITVKADPGRLTLTGLSQRYDGTPKAIVTVGAAGMVAVSYQVGGIFGPDAPTAAGRYAVRAEADGVTKTGTLVITKAPLYVVPQDKRKFAGEANPALTLEYEGFVGGDDETVLTRAPSLSTTAKTTSPGGVYAITAKGGAAANYALVYRQGTLVVESFASGYEALLVDALEVPSGKLSLMVAKSGRSYSGSLALAGETTALRISGPLATNSGTETASGAATVVRNGVTYALTFTLPMIGQVTGAVTRDSVALATAQGGRRLLSQPRGGRVDYSGAHTAVLKPAQPAGAGVPAGAGWARATINTRGAIALAGKLGDGTAFTTSLLPDADAAPGYRLWLQPYKPARVDTFLGGTFALKQHPVLSRGFVADGASLTWAKAERLPDKSYPEGFVPLEVSLKLDPWIKPSAIQPLTALLGLSGDSIEVAHSTTGSASDADLPTTVTLSTRNVVSVPGGSNPTKWQAKFNTANGTFTGSFELLDAGVKRKAPFSGVLRQPVEASDEVIGDGHFVIPATPGSAETLSGEVLLTRP